LSQQGPESFPLEGVDLDHPTVARVYDWLLGGTANWAIDREFGTKVAAAFPMLKAGALSNRLFLHRAVRHLVGLGVRQFIDIGSGIPTMGNTHEVADTVAPDSHVVYVDHEPVAVAHARLLLEEHGDPQRHAVIHGDLRDPDRLWANAQDTGVIDFDQPVAVLMVAVLHVQQRDADGAEIGPQAVARYRELMSAGSYLVISHGTDDGVAPGLPEQLAAMKQMYDSSSSPVIWRTREESRGLFGDFELLEPGMTWTQVWHPEEDGPDAPEIELDLPEESAVWCGVGRKP